MALDATNLNVQKFLDLRAPSSVRSLAPDEKNAPVYEIHSVFSTLPTAAGDLSMFPLVGTELHGRLFSITDVMMLPDALDLERFKQAVSKALSLYPTFSGRLRHDASTGRWTIALSNSLVPIYVVRDAGLCPVASSSDTMADADDNWAVMRSNVGNLVEPVNVIKLVNSDEPLMTVKVTYYPKTKTTAIGFMISHVLADGLYAMHFEEAVSSFYQSCAPSPTPRTRLRIHEPPSVPCPHHPLPPGGLPENELYSDTMDNIANTVPLCIRLHASQITEAKKTIMTALESRTDLALSSDFHLSAQDVMTALTIAAINRADPGHVTQVLTTVNFRDNPLVDPIPYGGNSLVTALTKELSPLEQTDVSSIALAVRLSMRELRDHDGEVLRARVRAAHETGLAWSNAGYSRRITQPRGRAVINSVVKIDRLMTTHFGYPGRVQYYTGGLRQRYIRMTRSNPLVVDEEVVDARADLIDVQFLVHASIREAVKASMEDALRTLAPGLHPP